MDDNENPVDTTIGSGVTVAAPMCADVQSSEDAGWDPPPNPRQFRTLPARVAESIRSAIKRLPPCCDRPGFTYIIRGGGLMKIGQSADPAQRIFDLQHSSPVELELVSIGRGLNAERLLHAQFKRHRRHGEWFAPRAITKWLKQVPKGFV